MWFEIEYNSKTPIYIQIKSGIKKEIIDRKLKAGEDIPSIREFARMLKVNQNTVAKGLKELEKEGILISIPGIGYKVNTNFKRLKESLLETLNAQLKDIIKKYKKIGSSKEELTKIIENLWNLQNH